MPLGAKSLATNHPSNVLDSPHLRDLARELEWFSRLVDFRLQAYFRPESGEGGSGRGPIPDKLPAPPILSDSTSAWAEFVKKRAPTVAERAAVILALVPHLRPQLLDVFFTRNSLFDRRFTEFGGVCVDDTFTPTGETLAFLLGGDDLSMRITVADLLASEHWLRRDDVIRLAPSVTDGSPLKAPLIVAHDQWRYFATGCRPRPTLNENFPAHRLETRLTWDDLVLHPGTLQQVREILAFVTHGEKMMVDWGMAPRLRPGHRALFYGPPGTGKTLTAALLGQQSPRRDVYRVDLSLVVSKYIGETEKNLARVFDQAQQQGWILFFDEADALFGKRTETKNAHDRYANQEVAYLLQRLELFDGIVVLASNMRENLDVAFARRFESNIFFPLPRAAERLKLWRQGLSTRAQFAPDVDLPAIAEQHELAGGAIMNVIRQVSLAAIVDGERPITQSDFTHAIRRELSKEGRRA